MNVRPVPTTSSTTWIDGPTYKSMYAQSIEDPFAFWAKQGEHLDWMRPYSTILSGNFGQGERVRWFEDGTLNACVNCIDRHLPSHAERTALIWESDDPTEPSRHITFEALHQEVCAFTNVLKAHGVKKGDRIIIYLPMIPESAFAMLACARMGAVHSVVFAGFSAQSLRARILDCDARVVITADESLRGGKKTPLKLNVDAALNSCPNVHTTIVVKRTGASVAWNPQQDFWLHEEMGKVSRVCAATEMNAEDPLFILYTSGSTGTPKGVVHSTGGYLLFAALTHKWVLDYHDGDIYWCGADIGWITGHSYIVYGPLANGATTLMFEGVPNYPDASRFWQIVDKHRVNIFYTAPTAIRSLMREGDPFLETTTRKSLRLLASVGEPINPEAWMWYYQKVGQAKCPVIDTWWQTETGGHMIAPFIGAISLKPGAAMKPFFGIEPVVVDMTGQVLPGASEGILCIGKSWPGQLRTIYGDHGRYISTYFGAFPGLYFTGDGCRRDEDGDFWITGRIDDVLNVAGHRLSTAEIESACVGHASVAEAAAVACPHSIKGQGIYVFITLKVGFKESAALRQEIIDRVRAEISPIATPDFIQWTPALPKTRSGKIMRRILRKIAAHDTHDLGDISTLAEPAVIENLIAGARPNTPK